MTEAAAQAASLLDGTVRHAAALQGGDLSQVLRVELADGRTVIAKSGPAPRTEAAMLAAIGAAGAPAPRVLAVSDTVLVLECLPGGGDPGGAWRDLGAVLARLHGATGPRYGWHCDYAFGQVAIENGWSDDWPAFWAERRLLAHAPHLPAALARRIETLAADLHNRLPRHPTPSLLHGDLWAGNILVADRRVTGLIDPACYYGHGEVDVAMLSLFNSPGQGFFDSFCPLQAGGAERLAIYSLWPALAHLRLFGAAYRPLVERCLSATNRGA
jgi:fructosamine-3-kinase